jgi:hypothetical protein
MKNASLLFVAILSLSVSRLARADAPVPLDQLNFATVDTSLDTLYTRPAATRRGGPQLRDANAAPVPIKEFAFDGDPKSFFGSAKNPIAKDHFTLIFDKPVTLKSITATTGKPDGSDKLDAGVLQVSSDGATFTDAGKFAAGIATAKNKGKVIAVRIKPSTDLTHPLAISEITIDSDPKVVIFKYPVEIFLNYDDAPDMKDWAEKCAKICERQYYMLNEELKSDGFKPATWITMTLKERPNGVAETSGNRITGTVKYFKDHQKDFGAMVHETTHVVQHYRGRNPGWLVEGLCDYVRFFKYEPGKIGGINPATAHYNGSYRVTARFLNYIVEKYDKDAIQKLNTAMREGKYKEALFKEMTGKTLPELDEEWRATLKR